jgi:hypothetical protein
MLSIGFLARHCSLLIREKRKRFDLLSASGLVISGLGKIYGEDTFGLK